VLWLPERSGGLQPTDGELTELWLRQPEVAVEIVELLLETLKPVEMLFR
jgi:hypothetical protein